MVMQRLVKLSSRLTLACSPLLLGACATLGKVMSPYSETFSCKNSDHGQCIDPAQAHSDAVTGVPSRSRASVTRDRSLLRSSRHFSAIPSPTERGGDGFGTYQDSLYRELKGLIDAPETPMLRQGRTVRTLILPYATSGRPDRLYMARYVYSILEQPEWVVGEYIRRAHSSAAHVPVLEQVREGEPGDAVASNAGGHGDLSREHRR